MVTALVFLGGMVTGACLICFLGLVLEAGARHRAIQLVLRIAYHLARIWWYVRRPPHTEHTSAD